jgi:hypothetical protein
LPSDDFGGAVAGHDGRFGGARLFAKMKIAHFLYYFVGVLLVLPRSAPAQQVPAVHFDIDARRQVRPISRYIYGVNECEQVLNGTDPGFSRITFARLGGNRMTAYNWTNNASNAGNDWHYQNDDFLVSSPRCKGLENVPGEANVPLLQAAYRDRAATLLTIPTNGYVSADAAGDGDVRSSGPDYLARRFRPALPRKNAPFTLSPDPDAPAVYEDEFVNWVKSKFSYCQTDPDRPVWFNLDNEPDIWGSTHPEVHPGNPTYAEIAERSIAYAEAAKDVLPATLIFGPASYGWEGFIRLQNAADSYDRDFQSYYLKQMALADKIYGKRLLDVLDVHWYPEAVINKVRVTEASTAPEVVAVRLQIPQSLWDAGYVEPSWVTHDSLQGGAIALIPRLMRKIDQNYPGTKLAFTEYNYGGGQDISGGIAEADVLGIFGRYGVFAAALWPDQAMPFFGGAIAMYRDFDGKGGSFGDTSISAENDDTVSSSVYASLDSRDAGRMVIVAINKTDHPLPAVISLSHFQPVAHAAAYQLTAVSAQPQPAAEVNIQPGGQNMTYTMPPMSVSTICLTGG